MGRRPLPPHDPEDPLDHSRAVLQYRVDTITLHLCDHPTTNLVRSIGHHKRVGGAKEVALHALDTVQEALNEAYTTVENIYNDVPTSDYKSRFNPEADTQENKEA